MEDILWQKFKDIPMISKTVTLISLLMTLAVQLKLLSPLKLYLNPKLIVQNLQIWRPITALLFFGPLRMTTLFNIIVLHRILQELEEGPFSGRPADLFYFLLMGGLSLNLLAITVYNPFILSSIFSNMLIYVWCRKYYFVQVNFFGFLEFPATYMPFMILLCSLPFQDSFLDEIMGIVIGHLYYFLDDVYPSMRGGSRLLETPPFITALFQRTGDNTENTDSDDNGSSNGTVNADRNNNNENNRNGIAQDGMELFDETDST